MDSMMLAAVLAAALMVAGCDRNNSSATAATEQTATAKPGAAAPPSPMLPARPAVPANEVLAVVNDKSLGVRDMEMALLDLRASTEALGQEWTPLATEDDPNAYDLHDLLNDLIVTELRSQDAASRGIERNTDAQYRFAHRFRGFFAQEWINWQLERMTVTDAEVEAFYQENEWGFREPERVKLRQMVLTSEEQAKAALRQLLDGAEFTSVASQMSARPDAAKPPMADQWVLRSAEKAAYAPADDQVRDLRDPVLEQAAFAIDRAGGTSTYVKGADGNFHIFQLIERLEGRQRPLVEVADNIKNFLRVQKLAKITDEMQNKAKVQKFPERLKEVTQ